MKDFLLLFLWMIFMTSATTNSSAVAASNPSVEKCTCPFGYETKCTSAEYCVYGINDVGEIFINGKDDKMDLTNVALQRKAEIAKFLKGHEDDDVLVNLYSPQTVTMAIFYYACQKCDDLKQLGSNITVSKLKVFLLSLYNQRMKLNLKYSQSDFQYYFDPSDDVQLMPEISVRPFWKNRLMFNSSCARKGPEFTQKHYIPAFLTQDLCILDYKYIQVLNNDTGGFDEYQTKQGEITYSLTLSNMDLYHYDVVVNSTNDLPTEFQNGTDRDRCKASFHMDVHERFFRYFCLCENPACTLKVALSHPGGICPYKFGVSFNTSEYPLIYKTSNFTKVYDFFLKINVNNPTFYAENCFFAWQILPPYYSLYIRKNIGLEKSYLGYQSDISHSQQPIIVCPFNQSTSEQIGPILSRFFSLDVSDLRYTFFNITSDRIHFENDLRSPVGANCSGEGPFSDPLFSSAYGFNSSAFPCYWYFEITTYERVYPIMGLNIMPVTIAKGKDCYYYTVKLHPNYILSCSQKFFPIMTIAACPQNVARDEKELNQLQAAINSCPTMKRGESKWKYKFDSFENGVLCGQFLYGLKKDNGIFVPAEIEFRKIYLGDLKMVGMLQENVVHGCGFNASQQLTLCTCYAALGKCHDLYTAGRIHLFRYLPYSNLTTDN